LLPAAAITIHALVAGNGSDPALQFAARRIIAGEVHPYLEKGILDEVFCVLRRAAEKIADAVDEAAILLYQVGPGVVVTAEAELYQFIRLLVHLDRSSTSSSGALNLDWNLTDCVKWHVEIDAGYSSPVRAF
jgi:hypothetical protein